MSNQKIAEYGEKTQFKKGQSGHEGYKGPHITTIYNKILAKKIPFLDPVTNKPTKIEALLGLAYRKVYNGLEGNGKDIEDIFDRVYGKVIDKTELSGQVEVKQMGRVKVNGKPLEVDIE